jgi:uncharacterized protein (DUF1800 family)
VSVTVSPTSASPRAGDAQQFTATVTGTSNTTVTWSVNGVVGGNTTVGTINIAGLYTAPTTVPSPNTVTVTATSVASSGATANASVSVLNPIPIVTGVNPSVAGTGTFVITVTGSKFVSGAQISFGSTRLTTTFISSTQLMAAATATAGQVGSVAVTVSNPDPGAVTSTSSANVQVVSGNVVSATAAARFLEQATFGPTPWLINQVQQVGFTNFLNDQFNAPSSTFDDPQPDANGQFGDPNPLQSRWFFNALYMPDQLRQRSAFALHKIWVVSWVVVSDSRAFVRYLRMHQQHAFGNYREVMENVTKDPAMGRYQDIANNDKPDPVRGIAANENYGRELMQLFTIGVWKLNPDGTLQLDALGNPIQAYDPVTVVENNARALTGWTYAVIPGGRTNWPRPPNYGAPLEAWVPNAEHHDMDAKTLVPDSVKTNLPPGQSTQQDLTDTLDNLFFHPNIAPFVGKLLIQQFVTSNPSPAYLQRVADAFVTGTSNGFGSGQRGDMKAVLAAILLDPEARRGDTLPAGDPALANDGKLKEPVLLITNLLRGLDAQSSGANLANRGRLMGQWLLYPPTVFSYFPPDYQIPGTILFGPEFNIQTTATTFERINFINTLVFGTLSGTTINWNPLANLSANPDAPGQLLDTLDFILVRSRMSAQARASILQAVNAVTLSNPPTLAQLQTRAKTAVYLIASSSQYQVQQ